MTVTFRCLWCGVEVQVPVTSDRVPRGVCARRAEGCVFVPLRPVDQQEYAALRRSSVGRACVAACGCGDLGGPSHWPSALCVSNGNGPGKPVCGHCTCNSCW